MYFLPFSELWPWASRSRKLQVSVLSEEQTVLLRFISVPSLLKEYFPLLPLLPDAEYRPALVLDGLARWAVHAQAPGR